MAQSRLETPNGTSSAKSGRKTTAAKHDDVRAARGSTATSKLTVSAIIVALGGLALSFATQTFPELFRGKTVGVNDANANIPEDQACGSLAHWLPDIVHLPGSAGFANQWRAHWSEEAQNAVPSCVARPRNVTELSNVVQVLKNLYDLPYLARARGTGGPVDSNVRFVVRSGGHSVEVGQSSIRGGVLIDLNVFNTITVADDRQSVLIGAGARWGDVFSRLDEVGLSTAGGRNARVGVGGLTLGGGLSWLSPQVGMVQDNIVEYEIVLANGTIMHATEEKHSDLWRALKGGSGNFGIVTSFRANTFPATKVWGGHVYYLALRSITDKLLSALHDFGKAAKLDKHAAVPILAFGNLRVFGFDLKASCNHVLYTKPQAWPLIWDGFKNIFSVWSSAKIRSFASAAEELVAIAPYGKQQYQATLTIKNDIDTIRAFHDLFDRSWDKVKQVRGISWAIVFQPLTPTIIHRGSTNVLGLETRNTSDPLLIVLLSESWNDASQNTLMYQATRELIASLEIEAMRRNTLDRYLYLNYAASWQNVFASYGEDNREFLRSVSRKYDEHAFWQHARAGGFKLDLDRPGLEAYPKFERSKEWKQPVFTPPAHVHGSGGHHHDDHGHDHHHH